MPLAPAPLTPPPTVAVRALAGPFALRALLERRREGAHLGLAGRLARIDLRAPQRYLGIVATTATLRRLNSRRVGVKGAGVETKEEEARVG